MNILIPLTPLLGHDFSAMGDELYWQCHHCSYCIPYDEGEMAMRCHVQHDHLNAMATDEHPESFA